MVLCKRSTWRCFIYFFYYFLGKYPTFLSLSSITVTYVFRLLLIMLLLIIIRSNSIVVLFYIILKIDLWADLELLVVLREVEKVRPGPTLSPPIFYSLCIRLSFMKRMTHKKNEGHLLSFCSLRADVFLSFNVCMRNVENRAR